MEIAEQWQREWTGAAEYGKVTEGGVTRNIARAMEVLHASKPGAQVRVMRAAYHSSAGPGVPASSYMLHSSRRVISSGFDYTETPSLPSLPTKPLEISSSPLDSSPDFSSETENYKVTEPDDLDISEPSKWRSSSSTSTLRLPSEESSSTDNASIIDIDTRTGKNLSRKYSYDSENSDIQWNKSNTRVSPILSAPVALNTLKYKSLLNSSNDWHNRRKSYSFEDTATSKESMLCGNDTIAMQSSTDSGICKSSEIVNEHTDDIYLSNQQNKHETQDETFTDWLWKNSFYNGTKFKTYKEHNIIIEEPHLNNITLQSTGKMTISVPITVESESSYQHKKNQTKDAGQRKVKKVEFCKTELHFAAETGKVNIIATDEKPPPSSDFRKRRSLFLPLHDMPEKPITLFGDKINEIPEHTYNDISEADENTAATKSILKNKIPKPKPYLLGENMAFGSSNDYTSQDQIADEMPVLTAVSLINRQLQSQRRYSDEITSSLTKDIDMLIHKNKNVRTNETGPAKDPSFNSSEYTLTTKSQRSINGINDVDHVKTKFHSLERSAIQQRPKTRVLRETDLTYFGVDIGDKEKNTEIKTSEYNISDNDSNVENIFQSVKLIQKITNSVCSSETELDDMPEYQNIPVRIENVPVPTPRLRTKCGDKPIVTRDVRILKPIVEQEIQNSVNNTQLPSRRSRFRREENIIGTSNRSVSEPPKRHHFNSLETTHGQQNQSLRCKKNHKKEENSKDKLSNHINKSKITDGKQKNMHLEIIPVYVNVQDKIIKPVPRKESSPRRSQRYLQSKDSEKRDTKHVNKNLETNKIHKSKISYNDSESLKKKKTYYNKELMENIEPMTMKHQQKLNENECVSRDSNKSTNNKHKIVSKNVNEKDSVDKSRKSHSTYVNSENTLSKKENSKDNRDRKVSNVNSTSNEESKQRSSKENVYTRKEITLPTVEHNKKLSVHNVNSIQIKVNDNNAKNKESNTKHRTTRKSEYVINYDDKHGTVSSVCKIKQGTAGTSRKKNIPKEFLEENAKEHPLKIKALNRIALLQNADQPRPRNEFKCADMKWKTKVYEKKSCQLL